MFIQNREYRCPLEMFAHWEASTPNHPFLMQARGGSFESFTWREAGQELRRVVAYLESLKLAPGSHVAILGKNSAHWVMADLAIWLSGHVSVPLYPNLAPASLQKVLVHSDAAVVFVGKLDNAESLMGSIPESVHVITFPEVRKAGAVLWLDIQQRFAPSKKSRRAEATDLASIIYTSGTTGEAKGVMHTFQSFVFAGFNGARELEISPQDKFFSYLPLAHVAERLLVETFTLYSGSTIYFAESLATFPDDLRRAQPTIFLAVPRVWTKFQQKILAKFPEKKLKKLLAIPVLSRVIKKKIRAAMGLNNVRIALTGAAPTSMTLFEFFSDLGIKIQEAYGMTENYTYSHYTRPELIKFGAVGQPFPGVEVKFSEAGEILIKTPTIFSGYYKDTQGLYAQMVQDGFLHTGDQGSVDSNRSLQITGRVKDLFKTAKGKYVAPSPIELSLQKSSHIEMVCVTGVGLGQPLAICVLSDAGKATNLDELTEALELTLKEVNRQLDPHERLTKLVCVPEVWSPERGELTPTMKIKRNVVESMYEPHLVTWDTQSERVVYWRS